MRCSKAHTKAELAPVPTFCSRIGGHTPIESSRKLHLIIPRRIWALKWIGELYEIDDRAGDDLALKVELRRTESRVMSERLKTWLWSQAVLKTLSIGKAAAYVIANWSGSRSSSPIPKSRSTTMPPSVESEDRSSAAEITSGRSPSADPGRRPLIETAKLNEIDPTKYLLQAARAADRGEILLPWQLNY